MISAIKVLLLLSALACMCHAQQKVADQHCRCTEIRNKVQPSPIEDVKIYPKTDFCSTVEIIVTHKSGSKYCLNPDSRLAQKHLARIIRKK